MSMKIYSCYYSGEGFYNILSNSNSLVFLNTIFPCAIKDLYKSFENKKEHNLKVLSMKPFIKLGALRDSNFMLSFFYPRGFVADVKLNKLIGKDNFIKFESSLNDLGEIVAIKVSPFVVVTVNYWKTCLNYGLFLNYMLVVCLIIKILQCLFGFNYNIFRLFSLFTKVSK